MFGGTDHIDHSLQVCSPYFSTSMSKGEPNVLQILFKWKRANKSPKQVSNFRTPIIRKPHALEQQLVSHMRMKFIFMCSRKNQYWSPTRGISLIFAGYAFYLQISRWMYQILWVELSGKFQYSLTSSSVSLSLSGGNSWNYMPCPVFMGNYFKQFMNWLTCVKHR